MTSDAAPQPRQPALTPPKGAQREAGAFLNPDGSTAGPPLGDVWKMMREGGGAPWPDWIEDAPQPVPMPPPPGHASVTFLGHSSFLIQAANGPNLLIDPIWSERCSPFGFAGPKRVRAPGLGFDRLPKIDAVLVSHNHYDHCDIPTLKRLQARFQPQVFTGLGNAALLARHGMTAVTELDWWQAAELPGGMPVHFVPAQHASARSLRDRGQTLWGGFVLEGRSGARLYFAGDSAWGPHFAEIGARLGPFALGLLPIGAYEPRWFMRQVHVNPQEAVDAFRAARVERALAMHFGTFKLTQEGIDAPVVALAAARAAAGLPEEAFRAPALGETILLAF